MLARKLGVQSVLQFIPKMVSGVEVRVLCRILKFFHTNLGKPRLHRVCFVHRCIVSMLEQVWDS